MDYRLENLEKNEIKWNKVFNNLVPFMVLPPIIGLPFAYINAWKKATRTSLYTFFLQLACFMGAINATKSPGGDQVRYATAWLQVPKRGFWGSLLHIYGSDENTAGKEFINGVINYVGYYLSFGYFPLFMFLMSIMLYMCIFVAIEKVNSEPEYDHKTMITGATIVAFFYLFFNLSFVLQKQFLANGFFILLLAEFATTEGMGWKDIFRNKTIIVLSLLTLFTHTSFGFLLPFVFIPRFKEYLSPKEILLTAGVIGIILANLSAIGGMVDTSNGYDALSYSFNRLQQGKFDDGLKFEWIRFFMIGIPMISISWYYIYVKKLGKKNEFIFFNIFFVLLSIVIISSGELLKYRYFMVTYSLMPFIIPRLSTLNFMKRDNLYKFIILFFIISFFVMFETIVWDYAPVTHIVSIPPAILMFLKYSYLV